MAEEEKEKPVSKLSTLILAGPENKSDDKEQGREDQIQAFNDFENTALPLIERMDALSFFMELSRESGLTEIDE